MLVLDLVFEFDLDDADERLNDASFSSSHLCFNFTELRNKKTLWITKIKFFAMKKFFLEKIFRIFYITMISSSSITPNVA